MDQMLLKNHQAVIVELMTQGQGLLSDMKLSGLAGEVEEQTRLCMTKDVPVIMFYGLYNAGKSTLINALCQKEVAKVGDVPTTATIQQVPWNGYTLIDTPGINANEQHTKIAVGEIDRCDVVLFVVDNADGFEREIVAQAVVEIMRRGKAVAVVVNQKNVDGNEDINIPVPHLPSMARVSDKVLENLNRQAAAQGLGALVDSKTFLGIYPVNAQSALEARELDQAGAKLMKENSGINTLVNEMDRTILKSSAVRMLLTPATILREKLKEALAVYEDTPLFGTQENYAKERRILAQSRQRMGDRLKAEGLRKIDAAFEEIQAKGASGAPIGQVSEQLQRDLTELIRGVAAQESEMVSVDVKKLDLPAMPDQANEDSGSGGGSFAAGLTAAGVSNFVVPDILIPIPGLPVPSIPIKLLVEAALAIIGFIAGSGKDHKGESSDEGRMAAYYKWRSDLRDQEVQVKANYTAAVEDFLQKHFDKPLEDLDRQLAQADDACREHTEYVRKVEQLLIRTSEEIAELSLAL